MGHETPIVISPGDVLDGRFQIVELLGAGTMGAVFRARDLEFDEEVACKAPLDTSPYKTKGLVAQYQKLRHLGSSHLPVVLGLHRSRNSDPSFPFFVVELVEGLELLQWCKGRPLRHRLRVIAELADTLSVLSAAGSAHGDLGSGNVLITRADRLVVIDPDAGEFGSQREANPTTSSGATADAVALSHLLRESLTADERRGLTRFLAPLETGKNQALAPSVIAAGLRSLLALPSMPGEASAPLPELATEFLRRHKNAQSSYAHIVQARDLAFRALSDLLSERAALFGLTVKEMDTGARRLLEQRETSAATTGRGDLQHRYLECVSPSRDTLILSLHGKSDFRLPWPYPEQLGLIDRGFLNVSRDQQPVSVQATELHLREDSAVLFLAVDGDLLPLGDEAIERALRILAEVIWPGVPGVVTRREGPTDPALPVIQKKFLDPSFDALPATEFFAAVDAKLVRARQRTGFDPGALVEAVRSFNTPALSKAAHFVIEEFRAILVPWRD